VLASAAHADGAYFTDSGGPVAGGGAQSELHVGVRLGDWGLELQYIVDGLESSANSFTALALGVRYVQPVSQHFSMYLRGRAMRGVGDGFAGNGLGGGAGLQLAGHTHLGHCPIVGALFVEADEDFYRFQGAYDTVDTTISALAFGIALGTDF